MDKQRFYKLLRRSLVSLIFGFAVGMVGHSIKLGSVIAIVLFVVVFGMYLIRELQAEKQFNQDYEHSIKEV